MSESGRRIPARAEALFRDSFLIFLGEAASPPPPPASSDPAAASADGPISAYSADVDARPAIGWWLKPISVRARGRSSTPCGGEYPSAAADALVDAESSAVDEREAVDDRPPWKAVRVDDWKSVCSGAGLQMDVTKSSKVEGNL